MNPDWHIYSFRDSGPQTDRLWRVGSVPDQGDALQRAINLLIESAPAILAREHTHWHGIRFDAEGFEHLEGDTAHPHRRFLPDRCVRR